MLRCKNRWYSLRQYCAHNSNKAETIQTFFSQLFNSKDLDSCGKKLSSLVNPRDFAFYCNIEFNNNTLKYDGSEVQLYYPMKEWENKKLFTHVFLEYLNEFNMSHLRIKDIASILSFFSYQYHFLTSCQEIWSSLLNNNEFIIQISHSNDIALTILLNSLYKCKYPMSEHVSNIIHLLLQKVPQMTYSTLLNLLVALHNYRQYHKAPMDRLLALWDTMDNWNDYCMSLALLLIYTRNKHVSKAIYKEHLQKSLRVLKRCTSTKNSVSSEILLMKEMLLHRSQCTSIIMHQLIPLIAKTILSNSDKYSPLILQKSASFLVTYISFIEHYSHYLCVQDRIDLMQLVIDKTEHSITILSKQQCLITCHSLLLMYHMIQSDRMMDVIEMLLQKYLQMNVETPSPVEKKQLLSILTFLPTKRFLNLKLTHLTNILRIYQGN